MHTYMYLVTEWSRCSTRARAVRTPDRPAPGGGRSDRDPRPWRSRAGADTPPRTDTPFTYGPDATAPMRMARVADLSRGAPLCATKGHAGREAGLCCLSALSAFRTHTQHHDRREKRTRSLLHASAHPRLHVRRKSLRLHVLVCGWARLKDSEEHLGSRPWLVSAPLGEADHDAAGERGEDCKAEHDVVARARDLAEGEHAPEC